MPFTETEIRAPVEFLDNIFKYDPLNFEKEEIRLIRVEPGVKGSHLYCSLKHAELDTYRLMFDTTTGEWKDRPYTALSYEWGSDLEKRMISVNGHRFYIRLNLSAFLETARSTDEDVTWYWIDAICLNQQDNNEKSHQIRLMGDIYRYAFRVFAWLGCGNPIVEEAVKAVESASGAIRKAADERELALSDQWEGLYRLRHINDEARKLDIEKRSTVSFVSAMKVFVDHALVISTLGYWQRLWIIPEVIVNVSVTLWYGCATSPCQALVKGIWSAEDVTIAGGHGLDRSQRRDIECLTASRMCKIFSTGFSRPLIYFLIDFPDAHCQNVQDRIYAFLHLASDGHRLEIDYSIAPEELCQRAISAFVQPLTYRSSQFRAQCIRVICTCLGVDTAAFIEQGLLFHRPHGLKSSLRLI